MAVETDVLDELRRLRTRVPRLAGSLAATVDGLVLAHDVPATEPEGLAALTAAALGVAHRMTDAAGRGDFRELLVRGAHGYIATYAAGTTAVLTLLADDRVNVGRLHLEGRRSGARIADLVDARIGPGGGRHADRPAGREGARTRRTGPGPSAPCPYGPRSSPPTGRAPAADRHLPIHHPAGRPHTAGAARTTLHDPERTPPMANTETSLKECLSSIDGATAAALVDYTSGMALGTLGGGKDLNLEVAAAGNTDVVRSKLRTMELLGLKEEIEDILITLNSQYHVIRLLKGRGGNGLFLYLVLDSSRANLAMARHQMRRIENELEV